MTDDSELLRRYAEAGSERAFAKLVSRHLPLVFSAALRQVGGDHELAKDIAQNVFFDLARKAGSLAGHRTVTGWLYASTRFAASNVRRSEQRRKAREQLAASMQALDKSTPSSIEWEQITPILDDVMHELAPDERLAVLLRFFERKNLRQVGVALGISEDAARMRIARALGKLQALLTRRGVAISGATLGILLTTCAVQPVPAGFASSLACAAHSGAGGGAKAVNGVLHAVRPKWKLLVSPGIAVLVLLTTTIYLKTHPFRSAPQELTQFDSGSAENEELRLGPETGIQTTAIASANAAPAAEQMRFELVDSETGDFIPGAKLRVNYFREGGRMKGVRLETDFEGKADIEPPRNPYTGANLFVTAIGHVPKVVSWGSAEFPKYYTMRLEPGSTIGGFVVDEFHNPVPNATISFDGPGIDLSQKENIQFGPDTEQRTDADGRWSCTMIPRHYERIQAMLTHPEFAPTPAGILLKNDQSNSLVLQIRRGVKVIGHVTDGAGYPVEGASVRQVHNRQEPTHSSTTDASGRFEMKNLRQGEIMLAVQAKGLAPVVLETNLSANPTELTFMLKPGGLLMGRVVDEYGAPISNAVAQTDWDNQGLRKIEWSVRTDHEGRFVWDSAPAEPLLYWFEADGFNWLRDKLLSADGSDHEIKLSRKGGSFEVTGLVTDAETGLPLDNFNVLLGEVRSIPSEPDFRFMTEGKEGQFRFSLRQPVLVGAYQVQIEKEGYVPIATTNLYVKNGDQTLELRLWKGSGPSGVVVLPNGQPASGATVFLYEAARGGVYMDKPGEFRKDASWNTTSVQTDQDGRFSFAPKLQARGLITIHSEGYSEIPLSSFNGTVPLQPWGRVEGKLSVGGQAGADETIVLGNVLYRYGEGGRDFPPLSLWLETATDAQGNFVFEKVPPGERKIAQRLTRPGTQIGRIYETQGSTVSVAAGTVTRVELGGAGRPVIGRVVFPSQAQTPEWRSMAVELRLKLPGPSGARPARENYPTTETFLQASRAFAEAGRKFWTSAEGRALQRSQRAYATYCRDDGSFLIPDVSPGTYGLKIETDRAPKNLTGPSPGPLPSAVLLTRDVVVPEHSTGDEDNGLDLGVLELN